MFTLMAIVSQSMPVEAWAAPQSANLVDWSAKAVDGSATGWQLEQFGKLERGTLQRVGKAEETELQVELVGTNNGPPAAQLVYPTPFTAGHVYRITLDIKASDPTEVAVMVRVRPAPYEIVSVRSVQIDQKWQTVTFLSAWPHLKTPGDIRVVAQRHSTRFSVRRLVVADQGPVADAESTPTTFPSTLIGIHVNKFGVARHWPEVGQGLVRMWDTGTTWKDLAPTPADLDRFDSAGWSRLDAYVRTARAANPDVAILFTLGQPPVWASGSPSETRCSYGEGTCGAPVSEAVWRKYVHALAVRYKGKIKYWELWNEPDQPNFFVPTASFVNLARAAREELRAVDAENVLCSPGFTRLGQSDLEQFLREGGGQYVDIIAFHWYYDSRPEMLAPLIFNIRELMKAYGAGDKPLWNTEGSPLCFSNPEASCNPAGAIAGERGAIVPRAILSMWLEGVSGYAYYTVEGMDKQSLPLVFSDGRELSSSGRQIVDLSKTLVGTKIVSITRFGVAGHLVETSNRGRSTFLVWTESGRETFSLPASWKIERMRQLGEASHDLPTSRIVEISDVPSVFTLD